MEVFGGQNPAVREFPTGDFSAKTFPRSAFSRVWILSFSLQRDDDGKEKDR